MQDTPEHINDKQIEIYQNMDPARRFKIAAEFIDMGIQIKKDRIKAQHPGASEKEITRIFIREAYGVVV